MVRENPVYGRGFLLQQANDFMGPSAPPPKDYRLRTYPSGKGYAEFRAALCQTISLDSTRMKLNDQAHDKQPQSKVWFTIAGLPD